MALAFKDDRPESDEPTAVAHSASDRGSPGRACRILRGEDRARRDVPVLHGPTTHRGPQLPLWALLVATGERLESGWVSPMTKFSDEIVMQALEYALYAPSVFNSQPWLWRIGPDRVELHVDQHRHLASTDPDRRDLTLSCGAALHHLRVALAGLGVGCVADLLPDPENSDHLATVRLVEQPPDPRAAALFPSIATRRTDRRPYCGERASAELIGELADAAGEFGTGLQTVTDPDTLLRLEQVFLEAAEQQLLEPGYLADLWIWTHRYAGARNGVGPASLPALDTHPAPSYLSRFPPGALLTAPGFEPDRGTLLVLTTPRDDRPARLRAGEAASAVLLTATAKGASTAALSQAVEYPEVRRRLRGFALRIADEPQLCLRVGFVAASTPPLPRTQRLPLESVLIR